MCTKDYQVPDTNIVIPKGRMVKIFFNNIENDEKNKDEIKHFPCIIHVKEYGDPEKVMEQQRSRKKVFLLKEVMRWYVHLSVFFHVFFKVSRMPELPVAVGASEPVRGSD